MKHYFETLSMQAFIIWGILILMTLFAFAIGWLKLLSPFFVGLLLVTTFVKGQLLADYFMGLNESSFKWRMITGLWLFVVLSLIALAYYLPV